MGYLWLFQLFLTSSTAHINNQWLDVEITNDHSTGWAGAVVSLYDRYSGVWVADQSHPFSRVRCQGFSPASGTLTTTDTSAVFTSLSMQGPDGVLPIGITITYTLVERGLEIGYRLEFFEDVELLDPLESCFHTVGWATARIENQTGLDETFPLNASTWFQRFSGSQLIYLEGGEKPPLLLVFPNVSKGIIWVEDYGVPEISMRFFDTEAPRENCMGPDLHSLVPGGEVREYFVRVSLDEYFAPLFISNHPHGYERTAAWMLDEIPFIHPGQGYIWGFSETSEGPEPVSASLIRLLEDHPDMKMDWLILPDGILTPNRDSAWCEPGWEWSWSHWHSTWRISTESTPEFRQWLINIQNNVYPWADRVRMGSHGYHHTPNLDSAYGEFHEFITYEPWEHNERFRVNMLDIDEIGLDSNMVNVVRFAGHRTSLSGLYAVIDHGFSFYCNGWRLIDWFAGKQFRNQWITMYQTPSGRIWGSNTIWWGDTHGEPHPVVYISEVLERGKFGLLGCHPISMMGWGVCPDAYARIDSITTSMEQDYPHFGWLFPVEYGDYLEACYNITIRRIRNHEGILTMEFEGAVPEGMTFAARLHPDDLVSHVTLDGVPVDWELRSGGRLFAVSQAFASGAHTLEVLIMPMNEEPGDKPVILRISNPSACSGIHIRIEGLEPQGPLQTRLFDLSGRLVYRGNTVLREGTAVISPGRILPSGVYYVMVSHGDWSASGRTVVLR
jgi:hypothetical protein